MYDCFVVIVDGQTQSDIFDGMTRTEARILWLYVEHVEGGTVEKTWRGHRTGRLTSPFLPGVETRLVHTWKTSKTIGDFGFVDWA